MTATDHDIKHDRELDDTDHEQHAAAGSERDLARKRVEKKHKFRGDVVAYVVINSFLIGTWAVTGRGYFWPGWILGAWAMFLLLDAWNIFYRQPITEADIDDELRRQRGNR